MFCGSVGTSGALSVQSGPFFSADTPAIPLLNASAWSVDVFCTCMAWCARALNTTCTPLKPGEAASNKASRKLPGPSACGWSAGFMAHVMSTGLGQGPKACSKNAVSSSVSVPCVIKTAPTSGRFWASATALYKSCQTGKVMFLLSMRATSWNSTRLKSSPALLNMSVIPNWPDL